MPTLRHALAGRRRMTEGRCGSLVLQRRALPSPPPARFIPALSPFPPPPPRPQPCSAASQVPPDCLTSRARSSHAYRLSFPSTARPSFTQTAEHLDHSLVSNESFLHAQMLRPPGVRPAPRATAPG